MGEGVIEVVKYWMEGEVKIFMKVWFSICISLCYCYFTGKIVPKGISRLFTFIPVICLFLFLPLNLHSPGLVGITAFFVAWLSNFKLLMFAFGFGPLSQSSISLRRFVTVGCFPIRVHHDNPSPKTTSKSKSEHNPCQVTQFNGHPSPSISETVLNPSENGQFKENPSSQISMKGQKTPLNYAVKILLLALIINVCAHGDRFHPMIVLFIYNFYLYLVLELILALVGALAKAVLGLELEPQFDEPYLSISLQDFWGRRWNLMVTRLLRPLTYDPVRKFVTPTIGRDWATLMAIMSTFTVSALMHELIFYYLGRVRPTWEITAFFMLHGFCLAVELAVKKVVPGSLRPPKIVSILLTLGFVIATSLWLFFPPLMRSQSHTRTFEDYAAIGAFFKDLGLALTSK